MIMVGFISCLHPDSEITVYPAMCPQFLTDLYQDLADCYEAGRVLAFSKVI